MVWRGAAPLEGGGARRKDLKETAEKPKKQVEAQRGRGTRWRFDEGFRAQVVAEALHQEVLAEVRKRGRLDLLQSLDQFS